VNGKDEIQLVRYSREKTPFGKDELATRHGADDQKWFLAIGDRVGQRGIRRLQRKILSTGIEPNKGTPLQSETVPNRAAQNRVTGFERVKNRSQGSSPVDGELHFVVHFR
jgi:hypothetical protein